MEAVSQVNTFSKRRCSTSALLGETSRKRLRPTVNKFSMAEFVKATYDDLGLDYDAEAQKAKDQMAKIPVEDMDKLSHAKAFTAARYNDIETIKSLFAKGEKLNELRNQFCESLLHVACRQGHLQLVKFLVEDAKVSMRVQDLHGRTPLHNACWSLVPNFELIDLLVRNVPDHLCLEDARGYTPFSYIPESCWTKSMKLLTERTADLRKA